MDAYSLARAYALQTNACLYITGKAGTGKTTFLRDLCKVCHKQMAVVAATGVAAINAEGVTIHSFFQLPPQTFLPTPAARRQLFAEMQMRSAKRNVLRNLELLIIDEISMVRADLLDAIDAILRHVKRYPQLPFGGVQVIFIGDLFQLSPVVRDDDWQLLRQYYDGPYFFQAHVMREIQPVYIEFDHIFRQQNASFIHILNEVRDNCLSEESRRLLNQRYFPDYEQANDEHYHIILSTHNQKVNTINSRELDKLTTRTYTYKAQVIGTFPENSYPTEEILTLREGARVMFIKNDTRTDKAFYNGKLGIVKTLDKKRIVVESDGEEIEVPMLTWENIRYVQNTKKEILETETIGSFAQFPLRLAWAVTIHKAQGLTFDHVVIDAAEAFAAGQVYVALSRCRTLEGLVLLSPIPNNALGGDPSVIHYTQAQPTITTIEQQLPQAENAYFSALLCSIFDFRQIFHVTEQLQTIVQKTKIVTEQAGEFVAQQLQTLSELQRVGEQFQHQLRHILHTSSYDKTFLQERLASAYGYFQPHITHIIQDWKQQVVVIESKEDSRAYKELFNSLLSQLALTQHLMKAISLQPTLQSYFQARTTFLAPSTKVSTSATATKKAQSKHPLLLEALRELRLVVAQENDVPAYVPAHTTSLIEIANQLPTTKKQLLLINGFGKKKYEMWGERILEVIREYCEVQHLL